MKAPLRIALAGQTYFREDNGQAAFTVRLARGLAGAGNKVLVIAPSFDGQAGLTEHGNVALCQVPAIRLPHNVNITICSKSVTRTALTSFNPNIVHIQDHYFLARTTLSIAQKASWPTVGTNHFLPENITDNLRLPQPVSRWTSGLLWRTMLSLYNRLSGVSAPSKTAVAILEKQKLNVPAVPISCGIDTSRFRVPSPGEKLSARSSFTLDADDVVFGYVGRIDREKGLDTVLDAFAMLKDKRCKLVIAGKGSYTAALLKKRDRLGLQKRILIPGFIPGDRLTTLLHSLDCFIMAGHAELQSIATLEAMASGLPVIAADARALPELVSDGINGFLFKPHDCGHLAAAMENFIRSANHRYSFGEVSRVRACNHDIAETVNSYMQWYRSILA